jgi:uncharacterized protein (TIGR02117 family)
VIAAAASHRHSANLSKLARATIIVALIGCACTAPKIDRRTPADASKAHHVFVVHDKWHAGIVVPRAAIAGEQIPELIHFPGAAFIEFSWGDAQYFPDPEGGISMALRAAFWSSGSVLHVVGVAGAVVETYRGAEIIEISLTDEEFQKLVRFIAEEFKRGPDGQPAAPSPGLSANSRFFPANSRFSLLRTCNTWIAEAFQAAGLPVQPAYVYTAGSLAGQLRPLAVELPQS